VEGARRKEEKKTAFKHNRTGNQLVLGVDVCAEKNTNDLFIFVKGD